MRSARYLVLALLACSCGPGVDSDDGHELGPVVERAIWERGEATGSTPAQALAHVCIPLEAGCLRLVIEVNVSDRTDAEQPDFTGALVGPDCATTPDPLAEVSDFHAIAGTGHGVLYVTGTAELDDGSVLDLKVAAEAGTCMAL